MKWCERCGVVLPEIDGGPMCVPCPKCGYVGECGVDL